MIQAIILDIDGVIVGEKKGYNFPDPHPDVLAALKRLHEAKIPTILCTAKPYYAVTSLIEKARLANPHIVEAGALIIDPMDNIVVKQHLLEKELVKNILQVLLKENVYVEFYTKDAYYIQESQKSEITARHQPILQRAPEAVMDIVAESVKHDVTKIMPIAKDEEDKKRVDMLLDGFTSDASISWGLHPSALPLQFAIITSKDTSKKDGAKAVISYLGIDFADVLGIGDTTGDWQFIALCGYKATVANGSIELKEKISQSHGFVSSKSVDENGILDILNNFA